MSKYKKMWIEANELKEKFLSQSWLNECAARDAINTAKEAIALAEELQKENKNLRNQQKGMTDTHMDTIRLLDSYMETNARQAQDIIELESVAIALYDYVWHHVHSVEDELKNHEGVTDLNAYKTIKALFEAEGED